MNSLINFVRRRSQPAVFSCKMYDGDLLAIGNEVNQQQHATVETGGDLFGLFSQDGQVIISKVIGAGPNSSHLVTQFIQDKEFYDQNEKKAISHGLQCIGSWHSHTHALGQADPTASDIREVLDLMEKNNFDKYVQMIGFIDIHTNKLTMKPYLFYRGSSDYVALQLEIMEGNSPFDFSKEEPHKDSNDHHKQRLGDNLNVKVPHPVESI
jgi:proteasome lid subunit RPN8/RPN11